MPNVHVAVHILIMNYFDFNDVRAVVEVIYLRRFVRPIIMFC